VTTTLPDGLVAVVKHDCPTCRLVEPVLAQLAGVTVYTQDDPSWPPGAVDDTALEVSWRTGVETVPTLMRVEGGVEVARTVGWLREQWEALAGVDGLGPDLPEYRPGCGSMSVDPDRVDALEARYGDGLASRRVELAELEDEHEALFDRGWTDGLPVVPPTPERVLRMLRGTTRDPDEVVAIVPPDLVPCTVEKVAVNAVMAGCLPEHLPLVLAALEAACAEEFALHGLLATTWSSGPVVIVNGPIARRIGMNSGLNALGQGTRANVTIGRALQLVVRNVGGGRPGGVDRAVLGHPGKLSFCFAEREDGSPFAPLAADRGVEGDAVTLFAGGGVQPLADQLSRYPDSLARSFAACLRVVAHPKLDGLRRAAGGEPRARPGLPGSRVGPGAARRRAGGAARAARRRDRAGGGRHRRGCATRCRRRRPAEIPGGRPARGSRRRRRRIVQRHRPGVGVRAVRQQPRHPSGPSLMEVP